MNTDTIIDNYAVYRPAYSVIKFDNEFSKSAIKPKRKKRNLFKKASELLKFYKLFTIFNVILEYDFKKSLIKDIISGITVGIMHIPQGLAYGSLTSLTPIYGLYTSFFPGLIYMIFGTSRHLSVGTFAVISLMVYSSITKLEDEFLHANKLSINTLNKSNESNFDSNTNQLPHDNSEIMLARVKIATALAFWCGIVQILMSLIQIGTIYKYLSNALLRGFTTAAAFLVLSSQVQHLFGIYNVGIRRHKYFKIFFVCLAIGKNIANMNWIAIVISVIAISLLIIIRIHVNERFKKQMKNIPIPTELIIVLLGTVVTYFFKLDDKYDLKIVGKIPTGLPKPSVPEISMFIKVIPDAVMIGVISFATSISVADLYAKKHKYKINSNKELFALGMSNMISSFFKCFSSSGALARSAVLESSGGTSQFATGIASSVVLAVLLWIAPLFEKLPRACLGSIIAASLVNLLKQVTDVYYYWKIDKVDCATWLITFLSIMIIDIDYGLFIGLAALLFLNTYRSQSPKIQVLGNVPDTELYVDLNAYTCFEVNHIKIIRFNDSLIYLNASTLKAFCNEVCPVERPNRRNKIFEKCCKASDNKTVKVNANEQGLESNRSNDTSITDASQFDLGNNNNNDTEIFIIILDCSMIARLDETSVKILKEIIKEYEVDGVKFLFANCTSNFIDFLKMTNNYVGKFDKLIHLTLHDAVLAAKCDLQKITQEN